MSKCASGSAFGPFGSNPGPCGPAPCTGECVATDEAETALPECRYCGQEFDPGDYYAMDEYCSEDCHSDSLRDQYENDRYDAWRDSRYDD